MAQLFCFIVQQKQMTEYGRSQKTGSEATTSFLAEAPQKWP
jgi:hypothetical protein